MRRLPVYFLIDVSESMVGEPIKAVEEGMGQILRELRGDPYALETVYISEIVFAGKAEVFEKLTELVAFQQRPLPIGSGTSLGAGLELLMREIERDVQPTTRERKGDWKPLVFLFTDGAPTDNPSRSIDRWNRDFRKRANLVAVSFGETADMRLLGSLTEDVLLLNDTGRESFREFFKWVSASIQVSSMSVLEGGGEAKLERIPNINLEKVDPEKSNRVDENFVIIVNRCGKEKKLYLTKFAKDGNVYRGQGAWLVDEDRYKRLGGNSSAAAQVSTAMLDDFPSCPVCGAASIVHCGKCGELSCYSGQKTFTCPWCGQSGPVSKIADFDINRARG